MTVPELRAECKRMGLPTYQSKGLRMRKADLVAQLAAHERQTSHVVVHESATMTNKITDPMAELQAKAKRDLEIDHATACSHASALGILRDELLDRDAQTMHRILRGCARPADERHWRIKATFRELVAGAIA